MTTMKNVIGRVARRMWTIPESLTRHLQTIPKSLTKGSRIAALQKQRSLRVHLGCGDDRLAGFLNIDYRPTPATDVVMDLNLPQFAPASVSLAFSNAFFEHIFRNSRLPHLQRIRDSLEERGACCYIGIPYFRNIARFYVERAPGTAGPVFDLYNVYRYTHGDPEQVPSWWIGQMHKSLFDEDELRLLLQNSGFSSYVVFCYAYPGDVNEMPVNMGFFSKCINIPSENLRDECLMFLRRFEGTRIRLNTLEWL